MDYDINDTSLGLAREHETMAWLRKNDPVHWDAKNEVWLLTRHADVLEALHHPSVWSSARGYLPPRHMSDTKNSFITMDEPEHGRHRRLLSRAFTPRMLGRQASRIRELMDDAIDGIADRRECDLVESLASPLPMKMIAGMVGFDEADSKEFQGLSDALFESSSARPGALQRGGEAFASMREHICRAIADRRREPRADLLSVLIAGVEDDSHRARDDSTQAIFEFALLLVTAGNETTRHTTSWGMHALLEHPEQLETLRQEPGRIPTAVEEWLRWASILRGVKRTALADTQIAHQEIRAGEQVLLLFPSANRDEEMFEQPFEFRADRQPNHHLAFSEGIHFCLGANLARAEMRIALERMLTRLPGLRLAPGANAIPKLNALTNGVGRLDVVYDSVEPR